MEEGIVAFHRAEHRTACVPDDPLQLAQHSPALIISANVAPCLHDEENY